MPRPDSFFQTSFVNGLFLFFFAISSDITKLLSKYILCEITKWNQWNHIQDKYCALKFLWKFAFEHANYVLHAALLMYHRKQKQCPLIFLSNLKGLQTNANGEKKRFSPHLITSSSFKDRKETFSSILYLYSLKLLILSCSWVLHLSAAINLCLFWGKKEINSAEKKTNSFGFSFNIAMLL